VNFNEKLFKTISSINWFMEVCVVCYSRLFLIILGLVNQRLLKIVC